MREECASRREGSSSHHTGINAVGTQREDKCARSRIPFSATGGESTTNSAPSQDETKGAYTASLPCRIFFCFPEIRQDRAFLGWRVHGVRNRPFQHTHLTW